MDWSIFKKWKLDNETGTAPAFIVDLTKREAVEERVPIVVEDIVGEPDDLIMQQYLLTVGSPE